MNKFRLTSNNKKNIIELLNHDKRGELLWTVVSEDRKAAIP